MKRLLSINMRGFQFKVYVWLVGAQITLLHISFQRLRSGVSQRYNCEANVTANALLLQPFG